MAFMNAPNSGIKLQKNELDYTPNRKYTLKDNDSFLESFGR